MKKRNTIIVLAMICTLTTVAATAPVAMAANCGGAETAVIDCGGAEGQEAVIQIIKNVVLIMTAGVMVLAVGATVAGGIIYTTSEGSPDKIKKAREIWTNTVIGLAMFAFMVAITNFLIPGGVFG